jgi:hypothetical protein
MGKRDIEVEASCLAMEQNGTRLAGDCKGAVALWMGDHSILASDGVAKSGRKDRLGRPYGQGRGCGVFDLVIRHEVAPGIVEHVPVSVKGCTGSGYGNRDVTMHHAVTIAHCLNERALWVFLCRQVGETVVMRRIDAARVIRETDCWHVRDDVRRDSTNEWSKKATESVFNPETGKWDNVRDYTRLNIRWAAVNKNHPHLFADSDWVPFDASIPGWPY